MVAKAHLWINIKKDCPMKKFTFIIAAVAALVGCSRSEQIPTINTETNQITLIGSIEDNTSRVTVDGEKFNEVTWEAGDIISLKPLNGNEARLAASQGGKTEIRFRGEGYLTSPIDTYYAIYPATTFEGSAVSFDYATQDGEEVAVLAGIAEDIAATELAMTFRPINSLLHITVSGVSGLSKAEFMSYDGTALPAGFTYDFSNDTVTPSSATTEAYTIDSPNPAGFFFALPAGIDLSNGYIIRVTDDSLQRNEYSIAFNGKVFERGQTTRVNFAWQNHSVTLGAKTSYSYYLAGDSASADKCGNTSIYFSTGVNGEDCSSSYSGIQDAMISNLGFEIDGTSYTYSGGAVNWDKATNTFNLKSTPSYSTAWGECNVKAFVVVNGQKIYSENTIWLTGLPYYADWRSANYSDWVYKKIADKGSYLTVDNGALGCIISPEFKFPSSLSVYSAIAACTGATAAGNYNRCYCYPGTRSANASESGTYVTIPFVAGDANDPNTPLKCIESPITLTTASPCVVHTAKDFRLFCSTNIYQVKITYSKQ